MGKRKVAISIIILLLCMQVFFALPDFFYGGGRFWLRAFTYSFFHANWAHLACNCIAVWSLYRDPCKPCRDLLFPFLIAVAVYPLAMRPVLGFSNVIYAAIGLRTPSLRSSWWRRTPVLVFLAVTVLLLFIPQFSATTHIAAFAAGMLLAAVRRGWLILTRDARRYY